VGHRYKNLFPAIVADANLREAYRLTALGKRQTLGYLAYKEESEVRLADLRTALLAGTYRPAAPHEFWFTSEGPAHLGAALRRSRRAARALSCHRADLRPRTDGPLLRPAGSAWARTMASSPCRPSCAGSCAEHGPEQVYFLKTDFKQYFASIDRAILWHEIERKIACPRTLALIERFTPRTGAGLPIGNLTSQLWANVYGHIFDRWLWARARCAGTDTWMTSSCLAPTGANSPRC